MNKIEALAYAEERLDKISYHLEMTNQLPCRSFYEKQQDMLIKATQALRAQQERENPKPLTLEELREMDEEPVWCVWLDTQKAEWRILHVGEIGVSAENWQDALWDSQYGKTWLAYAHPPKEDEV